jgi:hypothetical protein
VRPLFIGRTESEDQLLLSADDLSTHVHGIGATRSGKSKLIEWMARDLIRDGRGFCLIDPHGSLYNDVLEWLTYLRPRRHIVLFNPSHTDRIVGFNPFRTRNGSVSVQVDRLMRATLKAWGATSTDETPRLERWLRCGFHTLLEHGLPFPTLELLLSWKYPEVRAYFASRLSTPIIRDEWERLEVYKRPQDFDGQVESSWSRLFRFLAAKELVRLLGVPSNALDVEEIINQGHILLVNLQPSEALSREQARLIGTLLLDEIWSICDQRRRKDVQNFNQFFLIIDEFQRYLTPDVPEMLDEAAKRGLHLFLFHQRLDQLRERDPEAYNAVTTNARIKLVFGGLNREDARTMAEEIFPGQIDFKQVKFYVEQTKFWPKYSRDTVISRSSGSNSGLNASIGDVWNPDEQEFISMQRSGESSMSFDAEGSTNVPIFVPEPFIERTPGPTFSLEESLWMLADQLMEQYQRHFFIRRPGQRTLAAVTPFVKPWRMPPGRMDAYVESILAKYPSATEIDALVGALREKLISEAREAAEPAIVPSDHEPRKPRGSPKTLRTPVVTSTPQPHTSDPPAPPVASPASAERSSPPPVPPTGSPSPRFIELYKELGLPEVWRVERDLRQADSFFVSGNWREVHLNARSLLEGVLWDVAERHARMAGNAFAYDPGASEVRNYLADSGFLTNQERDQVVQAYRKFSVHMHPHATATRDDAVRWLSRAKSLCEAVLKKLKTS